MKKPITVKILVTVRDMAHFDACTLCFRTLRIGWPTAQIEFYVNGKYDNDLMRKILGLPVPFGKPVYIYSTLRLYHLAEWIRLQVMQTYPGPLVIVDPDTVFWKSCEDWGFWDGTLLAGYKVPRIWNDFARCVSVPRIHTSLMVFPETQRLLSSLADAYPWSFLEDGDYCPCDPFMPAVRFIGGRSVYWDCCANLYGMLRALRRSNRNLIYHFGRAQQGCYDHLNSASFYEVMRKRLEGRFREGFVRAHDIWVKNPSPGLWAMTDEYYRQKAKEYRQKAKEL